MGLTKSQIYHKHKLLFLMGFVDQERNCEGWKKYIFFKEINVDFKQLTVKHGKRRLGGLVWLSEQ